MAATQTVPTGGVVSTGMNPGTGNAPGNVAGASRIAGNSAAPRVASTAVVPVVGVGPVEGGDSEAGVLDEVRMPFSPAIARLPVELDVMVPVREFRVRNLLALAPGQVIESQWCHGEDVPVEAGAVVLAWSEFEVIDNQLAVRITRLP